LGDKVLADNTSERTAVYEGMFIFDSNRFSRDHESLPRDIGTFIEEAGGTVEVSRLWEERRLAYPIKGQRKGAYWLTYFQLPTSKVGELTRQCDLKEGILRQLFVRLPDSLVDPIISHAKGESVEEEPQADADKPATDKPAAKETAAEKPATEEPAAKETAAEKPATEDAAAEEATTS
jgi:small subunit ribosomal protein S6